MVPTVLIVLGLLVLTFGAAQNLVSTKFTALVIEPVLCTWSQLCLYQMNVTTTDGLFGCSNDVAISTCRVS
jgi:hypothetical protein